MINEINNVEPITVKEQKSPLIKAVLSGDVQNIADALTRFGNRCGSESVDVDANSERLTPKDVGIIISGVMWLVCILVAFAFGQ